MEQNANAFRKILRFRLDYGPVISLDMTDMMFQQDGASICINVT